MPPIYEIILSKRAQQDLLNIYDAICEIATPYNAEKVTLRILKRANSLKIFPKRGQIVFDDSRIRTIKVDNHRIFFIVDNKKKTVNILRFSTKGFDFDDLLK